MPKLRQRRTEFQLSGSLNKDSELLALLETEVGEFQDGPVGIEGVTKTVVLVLLFQSWGLLPGVCPGSGSCAELRGDGWYFMEALGQKQS